MRGKLPIAALVLSLSGCGVIPGTFALPADAPTPTPAPSQATSPPPSPAPTAPPTSAAPTPSASRAALTSAQAKQAVRTWVGKYNATLKRSKWWNSDARVDALFTEAALYEAVVEGNHESFKWPPGHKPINLTGTPAIYLPRPEQQPSIGDWFIAQATYKDVKGYARPHVLAFFRAPGKPFRLAVVTPIHWGQKMPKPKLDADGYITDMDNAMARPVAQEYLNFWNDEKKEGDSGYRLAKNSYSRKAFPQVHKGLYASFAEHSAVFGFRTADGGSFFLFGLLNAPKNVMQVLSEALLVPKGSKTIQELGANWFA
ncbi:hypothetical protein [Nonomuraea sp. NPDC002799]